MMAAVDNANTTATLKQRLDRFGGRLRPGLGGLWAWWIDALASWLPRRARSLFGLSHERLLIQRSGDGLHLALEQGETLREIGQLPWPLEHAAGDPLAALLAPRVAKLPRWLLLPAAAGLRRKLSLPAAASERLRDVVGFEIDRQTPFSAADVNFDARLLQRRGEHIDVELAVVPRTTLDDAVAALGPVAQPLAGIDLAGADGRALGINLLADAQRRRSADPWRGWNLAFVAIAAIALAAGLWQMLANRRAVADAFAVETQARAGQARKVGQEYRQLVDLVEGLQFLQRTRAGRPTTVEVLDELARRLPDNTYLEKLSIEDQQLMLIGQSSDASALVGKLSGSKLWRDPALTGAVQPDPRTRRDRFTLTATLVVADAPAPKEASDARSTP